MATSTNRSGRTDLAPTPPISDALIRWMEESLDKPVWQHDPNQTIEGQAMRMQFLAGRWSVLEELKAVNQRQKEAM